MSSLASTQIPKPSDEQAFERASEVLWRCLLNDPNVQLNGRRGQGQDGVDLFGIRDGDRAHHVGVQCKAKSPDHKLTVADVRKEVEKARRFTPSLREYFIVTTAPDDAALQELARTITAELHAQGLAMRVMVWGWNTLEVRIAEHPAARKAFDPSYTPHSEAILGGVTQMLATQCGMAADMASGFSRVESHLAQITQNLSSTPSDATGTGTALEAHLDAEIDGYRGILNDGRPKTALELLTSLLGRLGTKASGRIIFRIKANIGSCHLVMDDIATGSDLLMEAFHHAPREPKAIANQVYALLLKGQWQEALRFATEALKDAPDNEALAGYLLQAASHDPAVEQPLDLVPAALHETPAVLIAVTHFLRQRNRCPEWYEAARRAARLQPADQQIRLMEAEATLDEIGRDEAQKGIGVLSAEQRVQMRGAIDVLAAEWKQAQRREGGVRELHAGICSNLIVAYRMVGDLSAAMDAARQGRAAAPHHEELARRAVVVAMESGDFEIAKAALAVMPAGADTTCLSVGLHAQHGEWARVAELCAVIPDGLDAHDRINLTTLGRVAAIKLATPEERRALLDVLVADTADDLSASVIVLQAARSEKAQDLCDLVYTRLILKVGDSTHRAERHGIAHLAAQRLDWSTVADLLDGHVPEEQDSDELKLLARTFVNERPTRERGVRFFERLPAELLAKPFYVEALGLFLFNRGDLPKAEEVLRAAIQVSPTVESYLALFSTLRRLGRAEEIGSLLLNLDIPSLVGSAADRISIAAELRALGRGAEAMRIAYALLRAAPNKPEAALRYVGLVMGAADSQLIPTPETVGEDCWVRLESPDTAAQEYLITAGPDRPAEGEISLTHPMARKSLGLKVDDTFEVERGIGQRVTWQVAQIKHKYLYLLHEVMENFEAWFPETPGLWKFALKHAGDVTPFLDQIKAFGEKDLLLADLYLEKHLPLDMVAARAGRDPLGFAEYIRSLGKNIVACLGTDPEREAALALIQQHRKSLLVMDTYTAWVAATSDLLDVLSGQFAGLAIPQSVIDELLALRSKHTLGGGGSMTVAWRNGKFVRQEFTDEDIAQHQAYISEQIGKLEANCEVIPVAAPDAMTELAKFITSSFGAHVLDPAFLASQRAGLLLSDDMYFRQIGNAAAPVNSVWLQPILMAALDEGLIDAARYQEALVHLAVRGHEHLTVNANDLLAVFDQDDSEQLWKFSSVAAFFGVQGAEMQSHARVAQEFFGQLWSRDIFPNIWRSNDLIKRGKATGILLERLTGNRSINWEIVLAFIYRTGNTDLRHYVERWIVGHLLSMDALRAVLSKFSR